MTNAMIAGLAPTHPGEMLREIILPAVDRPKVEIARLLGISRAHLYSILAGDKPVSSQMALRLAKMFGGSAESWLRMQAAFDLAIAGREMEDELRRIPILVAA